ncbi:Hypothetical predicted protein [Mytilus galloprovincialis]|uniref:Ig-like domain-containing protein n=1 Tax=Mytilus galloprovincialis TaxID=29158 RepID=A0A8B6GEK9_MYTGA|nr:Hypothetical predicted protein [Mytilus galloprovincialis]
MSHFLTTCTLLQRIATLYVILSFAGNVELDPGITIHPAPSVVIAQKNNPLLLNYSASSSPDSGPVNFTWYKDGEPVLFDRRIQVRDNGSLYFTQVKNNRHSRNQNRNQNEFYECFMKNKYGTVFARQVQLQVATRTYTDVAFAAIAVPRMGIIQSA